MEGAVRPGRGDGRGSAPPSSGREEGVEGVLPPHQEVQVSIGEPAEAVVEDDGESDVVERGVVGGGIAGLDAAGVFAHGGVAVMGVGVLDRQGGGRTNISLRTPCGAGGPW